MATRGTEITLEEFFAPKEPASRELFEVVRGAIESVGESQMRVTKSQVAFRRRTAFAWAWVPGQYLKGNGDLAPLVLTVDLPRHDASPRWKEVVEPRPHRFTHHLEVRSAREIDGQVVGWIREAWEQAG
ncbi:MAG: hypothetical protein HY876_05565 [Coriobacteriales bacterium]|nr:hypothetical protein [Coriobacteriales bacterium]